MKDVLDMIRPYDAAPASSYDAAAATRAQARLDQILAAGPAPSSQRPHRGAALRLGLRWAAVPALAVLALVVTVVLPGGIATTTAFASWTAQPRPLDGTARSALDHACTAVIAEGLAESPRVTLDAPTLSIAERRGDVAVAVYTSTAGRGPILLGPRAESAHCLAFVEDGVPVVVQAVIANADNARSTSMSVTPDEDHAVVDGWGRWGPPRGDVPVDAVSLTSVSGGRIVDAGDFTLVQGTVGADVVGVVIHADGRDVEATVSDGSFLAWWPDSGRLGWEPGTTDVDARFTVTLRDGTVLGDVRTDEL